MNDHPTILAVDDDAQVLALLKRVLPPDGYVVQTAASGEQALAAAAARPPDLILLDIHLPGLDGLEVCQRLKANPATRHIPVILLSASSGAQERVTGLQAGAVDYLTKPFRREELLARVKVHLDLSRASLALAAQAAALREANAQLQTEVARRERTEESLRASLAQAERSRAALLGVMEDQQRTEAALRLTEAEFRVLAEAVPQIVWACRPDGGNIYYNQQWVDYTGMTLAESYGAGWNKPFHPDDQQRAWDAWQRTTEHGEPYALECRLRRADGVYHWWLIRGTPLRAADGQVLKWFGTCTDIEDLKKNEAATLASLREKEALLREIHHRVKNNLQIMSSLLRLQARQIEHPDARAALVDMQSRIRSMALIHEHLYRSQNLAAVDLAAYLKSLCIQLCRALVATTGAIQPELDLAPVRLEIDQAIPCGLLVNELIANCLKHGFPEGRTGKIWVTLQPVAGGPQLCLRVADNGVGLPPDFEARRSKSLGLQLVSDLTKQIGGTLAVQPAPDGSGVVCELIFTPRGIPNAPPQPGAAA